MQIKVTCPCGNIMKLRSEHAGRTGKCPKCDAAVTVPDEGFFAEHDGERVSLGRLSGGVVEGAGARDGGEGGLGQRNLAATE